MLLSTPCVDLFGSVGLELSTLVSFKVIGGASSSQMITGRRLSAHLRQGLYNSTLSTPNTTKDPQMAPPSLIINVESLKVITAAYLLCRNALLHFPRHPRTVPLRQ
jgi:hypothetical protein